MNLLMLLMDIGVDRDEAERVLRNLSAHEIVVCERDWVEGLKASDAALRRLVPIPRAPAGACPWCAGVFDTMHEGDCPYVDAISLVGK